LPPRGESGIKLKYKKISIAYIDIYFPNKKNKEIKNFFIFLQKSFDKILSDTL
jgi:hypothetical protein